MKKLLLWSCIFCAWFVSPILVILASLRYVLDLNINAFVGAFGIILYFASTKAFFYIDKNFQDDSEN